MLLTHRVGAALQFHTILRHQSKVILFFAEQESKLVTTYSQFPSKTVQRHKPSLAFVEAQ